MKYFYIYCAICIISVKFVKASINDFIVTEENDVGFVGNNAELLQENDDYFGDMAEYESCGYESPAQKYIYGEEDDYPTDGLIRSDTIKVLEYMLKEQEISLDRIQQLFAHLSSSPKYAEIFQKMMADEDFDEQSSCQNSPTVDIFTNGLNDDTLVL